MTIPRHLNQLQVLVVSPFLEYGFGIGIRFLYGVARWSEGQMNQTGSEPVGEL